MSRRAGNREASAGRESGNATAAEGQDLTGVRADANIGI